MTRYSPRIQSIVGSAGIAVSMNETGFSLAKKINKTKKTQTKAEAGIELSQITEGEWNQMKVLAIEINKSGQSDNCLFKASIMSFIEYIIRQDEKIYVDAEPNKTH